MAQLPNKDGKEMKQCSVENCQSTELVYSGVDAFLLGVQTETICYDHANQQAKDENNGN
jgi:hypothetical protein